MGVSRRRANKLGLLFFFASTLSLFSTPPAHALGLLQGYVEQGGVQLRNSGVFPILRSPTTALTNPYAQQSFPRASVDVYLLGTTTHVVLYPDAAGAQPPLPNPLTADTSGWFSCYVATGTYSVRFSGGGLPAPVTRTLTAGAVTSVASSPSINVKDPPYSATGDGVTDDTAAISTAITAAAIGPGALYFPPGVYIVSSQFKLGNVVGSIAGSSVLFYGAGMHRSRIKSVISGNTALFYLVDHFAGTAFTFRDMSFEGRHTGFVAGEGCMSFASATNAIVENCEIYNFNGAAISSNDGIGCQFTNNYIHDNYDEGVLTNGGIGYGNRVTNNTLINMGTFALDTNDRGTIWSHNYISGTNCASCAAVTIEANDSQSPQETIISDNVIVNNVVGVGINVAVDTTQLGLFNRRIVISGNTIDNNNAGGAGVGIRFSTAAGAEGELTNVVVAGNTITNELTDGVAGGGITGLSITGNTISVTNYAVNLASTVQGAVIGPNVAISVNHPQAPYSYSPSSMQTRTFPFSPAITAASGAVACASDPVLRYKLDGDELTVDFTLTSCTLSLATTWIGMQVPPSVNANGMSNGVFAYANGGTHAYGYWQIDTNTNVIKLYKDISSSGPWAQDLAGVSSFAVTARGIIVK